MIPLKDYNPTTTFPFVTVIIIGACVWIYFFVQPSGQSVFLERTAEDEVEDIRWTVRNAAIPCELVQGRPLTNRELVDTFRDGDTTACQEDPRGQAFAADKNVYLAALWSMFLHGGLLHLGGNMLFLWVFGNNIEDRLRPWWYVAFYLGGGVVATLAHVALEPDSTVPVVGASGAIAAVMGAYLVLFPNAPILSIVPIFLFGFLAEISAKWLLGFWLVSQFFISPNSGVAWAAHVGGFVFGALVALAFREQLRPPRQAPGWAVDPY
ncbi:MAG TPA: rhomboid family intramembrane serine protease [Acidimicrobiales bacterium]|nr:rhomboid family intramembrane serine protease [Acidimicrobiales bacterium]